MPQVLEFRISSQELHGAGRVYDEGWGVGTELAQEEAALPATEDDHTPGTPLG